VPEPALTLPVARGTPRPRPRAEEARWRDDDAAARALEPALARIVGAARAAALEQLDSPRAAGLLDRWAVLDLADLLAPADPPDTLVEAVEAAIREALAAAGRRSAAAVVPTRLVKATIRQVGVRFDPSNPRVLEFARSYALDRLRQVNEATREAIRAVLVDAAQRSVPPAEVGRQLRQLLGLTDRQALAVQRFRQALATGHQEATPFLSARGRALRDARYDRRLAQPVALTPAQVDRMTGRYAERMVAHRAETVARTESIRMLAEGNQEAWRQAVGQGLVGGDDVVRRWVVARDERVCPVCQPIPGLNREGVGLEQPFQTPEGFLLLPPAHPDCRCVVWVRPRPGTAQAPPPTNAARIMHRQVTGPLGSNPGGTWSGSDGVARYVKEYADPAQADVEALAHRLYRDLGLDAPEALAFETAAGRRAVATEMVEGAVVLRDAPLTRARASRVLDGFAADVLMANHDAVGTGLDNVVLTRAGRVVRIDQGGTLLFRARGTRRAEAELLDAAATLRGLADPVRNPDYARIFEAAGTTPEGLGWRLVRQVRAIRRLARDAGGWDAYVARAAPGLGLADRRLAARALDVRARTLQQLSVDFQRRARAAAAPPLPVAGDDALVAAERAIESAARRHLAAEPRAQRVLPEFLRGAIGTGRSDRMMVDALRSAVRPGRARALRAVLEPRFGDRWEQRLKTLDHLLDQWQVSTSFGEEAAILKRAAERLGATETTYHEVWFDHDPLGRERFLRIAREALAKRGLTEDDAVFLLRAGLASHRAMFRAVYGADAVPVYRGVAVEFFTVQGRAVPELGEAVVASMGPLASHSTSPGQAESFGGILLRTTATADDVVMHMLGFRQIGYLDEREVVLLGRPRTYVRVTREG